MANNETLLIQLTNDIKFLGIESVCKTKVTVSADIDLIELRKLFRKTLMDNRVLIGHRLLDSQGKPFTAIFKDEYDDYLYNNRILHNGGMKNAVPIYELKIEDD